MVAVSAIEPPPNSGVEVTVDRWVRGSTVHTTDRVAEEVPVALLYNGEPHVVMLATPHYLEDQARGFSLSEELVDSPDEIRGIEVVHGLPEDSRRSAHRHCLGAAWRAAAPAPQSVGTHRLRSVRCGDPRADGALAEARGSRACSVSCRYQPHEAHRSSWPAHQARNASTGSVHAAAWVVLRASGIACLREDVGRHNALDKTLGALVQSGADLEAGFMLVTSRASYEMVQKAATMGVTFMAALSAPTSFAIRHAQRCGLTLVAFARPERHVVYANGQRRVRRSGI